MSHAHILLYTDDANTGGVAQYNHTLLMGLADAGYRLTRAASTASDPMARLQEQRGILQEGLSTTDFVEMLTHEAEARRLFERLKPDLIFFSDSCCMSNLGAKLAAKSAGIPYIMIEGLVGKYLAEKFADHLPALESVFLAARAIIAVSRENLDQLRRHFRLPVNRGIVVHYGRPMEYFAPRSMEVRRVVREELGIPLDAVVCLTLARLDQTKGFLFQLKAMEKLKTKPEWSKLYFVWAGSGPWGERLKLAICRFGVEDRVKIVGQRWDIPALLDSADIFVLPSEIEGMPLSIMEAMAKSLPVIASAISGIPDELGSTGQLLADPTRDAEPAIEILALTIGKWSHNEAERVLAGQACHERACRMFRSDRMIEETRSIIEGALLPAGDYVTPGFKVARPDAAFAHLTGIRLTQHPWKYLRCEIPHTWYSDRRQPVVGFVTRDEASILHNMALQFAGKNAMEIGCWRGWSTCHLALGGVELDVVDPLLAGAEHLADVEGTLRAAGASGNVRLHGGKCPEMVEALAAEGKRWSLFFIDGDHGAPGPLRDAEVCARFAEPDAAILFHDLACPDVAEALDYLKRQGWKTLLYQTMQIMGVAWRGNVSPVNHMPDPRVAWTLPSFLHGFAVSGVALEALTVLSGNVLSEHRITGWTSRGGVISFN